MDVIILVEDHESRIYKLLVWLFGIYINKDEQVRIHKKNPANSRSPFWTKINFDYLSIAEILGVDTLAIAAMFGSNRTGLDLAHEWQKLLAGCQLPFLNKCTMNFFE